MPCSRENSARVGLVLLLLTGFIPSKIFSFPAENVEPATKNEIIFSHEKHSGAPGANCAACHSAATSSRLGADNLLPAENICLGCHERNDCGLCHRNPGNPQPLERISGYSPKFDHAVHRDLGLDCRKCHESLSEPDGVQPAGLLPAMRPCMNCHDGKAANKNCIVCHEDPKGKVPESHQTSSWLVRHVGVVLKDNGQSCLMCHGNDHCRVCHPGNYLFQ